MDAVTSKKYFSLLVTIFCSIAIALLCSFTQAFGTQYYTIPAQTAVCLLAGIVVSQFYKPSVYNYLFCLPLLFLSALGILLNRPEGIIFFSEFIIEMISFGIGINLLQNKMRKRLVVVFAWCVIVLVFSFNYTPGRQSSISHEVVTNDFNLVDQNKNKISLDSLGQKILLIDFWFTGCGACYKKMETVEKLNDEFKNDKDVRIVCVNAGGDIDSFNNYMITTAKKNWHTWQLYDEEGRFCKIHGVVTFPFEIIVKNGKVVSSNTGFVMEDDSLLNFKKESALLYQLKSGISE